MLDNLKDDPAGGERAVHELREAFDVSRDQLYKNRTSGKTDSQ